MDGEPRLDAGRLLLIAALALGGSGLAQAQTPAKPGGTRMVCWQDDAGNKACGDAVPAKYADRQRSVLDGSGRTIKVIPGALTPEQRAEKEARAREVAVVQQAADQQAAYDRALLATYSKPEELAALRDDRLQSLDTRIDLAEAALKRDTVTLAELRSRLPAQGSADKPPAQLLAQIKEYEEIQTDTQRRLAEMRRSREGMCANFTRDIQRYQELKTGTVVFQSPCPPPASSAATASSSDAVKLQPQVK